jgi:hypothetical protein
LIIAPVIVASAAPIDKNIRFPAVREAQLRTEAVARDDDLLHAGALEAGHDAREERVCRALERFLEPVVDGDVLCKRKQKRVQFKLRCCIGITHCQRSRGIWLHSERRGRIARR